MKDWLGKEVWQMLVIILGTTALTECSIDTSTLRFSDNKYQTLLINKHQSNKSNTQNFNQITISPKKSNGALIKTF